MNKKTITKSLSLSLLIAVFNWASGASFAATHPMSKHGGHAVHSKNAPKTGGYTINMNRPRKAGMQYDINESVQESVSSGPNKGLKKLQLAGLVTVVSVDPQGYERDIKVTVDNCTVDDKEIIPKGKTFEAERNYMGNVFLGVDFEVTPSIKEALRRLITFHDERLWNDQDTYGTRAKVGMGASWEVNGRAAAARFPELGSIAVKGSSHLVKESHVNSLDCLNINTDLIFGGDVSGTCQIIGLYPTDPNYIEQKQQTNMNLTFVHTKSKQHWLYNKTIEYKQIPSTASRHKLVITMVPGRN